MHIKTSVVLTLRVRLIGKSGFRFWNPDFGFCNQTRIRKRIWSLRNPSSGWIWISWVSFLLFDWEIRKKICKTILVNSGLLFANYACTCKTTLLQDSLSNPFSDFPIERYKRNLKTDISNPKSGFYDLNPDFPIESTLKKRNIAMWSAQYDCWKKKTQKNRLIREHLVVVVKCKSVLLTYTLFHNKIHNCFSSVTLTCIQEIY